MLGAKDDNEYDTAVAELPVAVLGDAETLLQPDNPALVPQQNVTVVDEPFAFTEPFSVAVVSVTEDAACVVAVGDCPLPPDVIKKVCSTGEAGEYVPLPA